MFLAGGILDLMDGALARLTGQTSRFGALLDSVMDRLGEAALFLGIAIYFVLADLSGWPSAFWCHRSALGFNSIPRCQLPESQGRVTWYRFQVWPDDPS